MLRLLKRLLCRNHKYIPYQRILDGNNYRTLWKCKRCGKTYLGI